MVLRETKEAGFESIGKENRQKGDHRVDLSIGIGAIGVEQLEAQQADAEVEEPADYARNAIPECLTS